MSLLELVDEFEEAAENQERVDQAGRLLAQDVRELECGIRLATLIERLHDQRARIDVGGTAVVAGRLVHAQGLDVIASVAVILPRLDEHGRAGDVVCEPEAVGLRRPRTQCLGDGAVHSIGAKAHIVEVILGDHAGHPASLGESRSGDRAAFVYAACGMCAVPRLEYMARSKKVKPFVGVTGTSTTRGVTIPTRINRGVDRFLAVQRPVVLAHLRSIRRRHPDATPDEVAYLVGRRYLAAVTTSGAAVGTTAVIPAVGTVTTLALSAVETAAFLEATALFAQSIAELHGLPVDDPERARALVLALMLGKEGSNLVRQWGRELTEKEVTREVYWRQVVSNSIPRVVIGPLVQRLQSAAAKRLATTGTASVLGKALPFGVGAVVGGAGNRITGSRVVHSAHIAFGSLPQAFPAGLDVAVSENAADDAELVVTE